MNHQRLTNVKPLSLDSSGLLSVSLYVKQLLLTKDGRVTMVILLALQGKGRNPAVKGIAIFSVHSKSAPKNKEM